MLREGRRVLAGRGRERENEGSSSWMGSMDVD